MIKVLLIVLWVGLMFLGLLFFRQAGPGSRRKRSKKAHYTKKQRVFLTIGWIAVIAGGLGIMLTFSILFVGSGAAPGPQM